MARYQDAEKITPKNFEQDSFVQVVAPNGDYRYGYVKTTDEEGWHLTICMHEEAESKLAYEAATDLWNGQPSGAQYGLSAQEIRVLRLVSEELSTLQMAQKLNLAPSTIRSYVRTLRIKLRADNRTQLVMVAKAMGKSPEDEAEDE